MNEVNEIPKEVQEKPSLPEVPALSAEFADIKNVWGDFVDSIKEFADSIFGNKDTKSEIMEAREYGVQECAEVAKECFPPEVLSEWGSMDLETRYEIAMNYANEIGEALGIDFKGVIWEENPDYFGCTTGDGYVHLNINLITDPAELMILVDTVAHESRHQMQFEAMEDPSKFPIDEASINEWRTGLDYYSYDYPSAYDPWGYVYNPMETDARYFGESMVRELTKDLINNA